MQAGARGDRVVLSRKDCLVAADAAEKWPIGDATVRCVPATRLNRTARQHPQRVLAEKMSNPALCC